MSRIFAVLAGSAFAGSAVAGGFTAPPAPVIAPVQEIVAPLTWQGAYIGGALGYGFKGDDEVGAFTRDAGQPDFTYNGNIGTLKNKGAYLSLRGGYRWERDNWVVGPELSVQGGNIKDSIRLAFVDDDGDTGIAGADSKEKYGLTLALKTGYKLRPETIIYGRAGLAHSKFDYSIQDIYDNPALGGMVLDGDFSATGYVVGLGAEHKLNDRLSLTGEINYRNFGKTQLTWTDAEGDSVRTHATPKYIGLEVGLNYQF
ncbi:MAG: outer membrane beta-barrel protein [Paracoccus sp. (in: a-proteobacteria)]|uniref:outer membrane protein n=1 Tax=Paracoccus sp. TaxID=267 RepID=UPI0026E0D8FD|nr:outer membrane beta-barrel protein [Paracoccus sp. (in: a-proteobacteria)]MDO5620981.1 outer membrane beta-barrel protein [Paracoccus sp. (in: a-proteobacteria)]